MPVGAWVPQIKASRYNAGEAFVVTNDYRRGDCHFDAGGAAAGVARGPTQTRGGAAQY